MSGTLDWQIVQQNERGFGTIMLGGRWFPDAIAARDRRRTGAHCGQETTGAPVSRALDWASSILAMMERGQQHCMCRPEAFTESKHAMFRLDIPAPEWAPRGDVRHFIGVGDLWIIAGQSNSAGYGRGPIDDPPTLGVHLLRNSEQWALAAHPLNESTDTRHTANREAGNPGHAPYLQFGRTLQHALGYPIGLIQTALGGSPLTAWNPTEPDPAPLFDNMLHCANLAGGHVRGIVWYQGESDTGTDDMALSYADRFCAAVTAWRDALEAPQLPVLTVQLNRVTAPPLEEAARRWTIVRDAQGVCTAAQVRLRRSRS